MGFWQSALTLLTALFLQVLSNFANDYGDSVHGADHSGRVGPAREVQSGNLSSQAMKKAMIVTAVLSFVSGCLLLWQSYDTLGTTGIAILLALGIAAIGAAIAYTNGKRPYGYMGLGDVSVFIFFGLLGVAGTQYLQTADITRSTWLLSIAFGCLSTGVLHLNNMRDRISDSQAGKISLAVRMGFLGSKIYHSLLLLISLICLTLFIILENLSPAAGFAVAMFITLNAFAAWKVKEPAGFDPLLKYLSISTFAISLNLQLMISLS